MQMPPLPISTPNMVLFLEGARKDGGDDAQSAMRWEAEGFAGPREVLFQALSFPAAFL